jgi:hypothetical protein
MGKSYLSLCKERERGREGGRDERERKREREISQQQVRYMYTGMNGAQH